MTAHRLHASFRALRRLVRDERAVAFIEFAYSFPVVIALGLAGLECANLALAHLRISQISMMVADNAGRVTTRIDEADIYEVFAGADNIGKSISFKENGRLILSSLQDNTKTGTAKGQMINWQRCFGNLNTAPAYGVQGKGRNDATLQGMGVTGHVIQSLPNTAVMVVETTYNYQPLIGGFLPAQTIRYESAFNVRERTEQDITNTKSLTVKSC
jgi:Flp pilus assembly protein TadG